MGIGAVAARYPRVLEHLSSGDHAALMTELLIGYARVSTNEQDLTAQQNALERLGVRPALTYTDHWLTGTNRARPGLREALAACRSGDTLVVAKLDRLARSLRDAKDIIDELSAQDVKLSIGGSIHDPKGPVGRLLFNVLAMVAEFESDLIRARTREGMQVAKAKGRGRLRGKRPKLSAAQQRHLREIHEAGTHSTAEIAELFNVARSTVYRTIELSNYRSTTSAKTLRATTDVPVARHQRLQREPLPDYQGGGGAGNPVIRCSTGAEE